MSIAAAQENTTGKAPDVKPSRVIPPCDSRGDVLPTPATACESQIVLPRTLRRATPAPLPLAASATSSLSVPARAGLTAAEVHKQLTRLREGLQHLERTHARILKMVQRKEQELDAVIGRVFAWSIPAPPVVVVAEGDAAAGGDPAAPPAASARPLNFRVIPAV